MGRSSPSASPAMNKHSCKMYAAIEGWLAQMPLFPDAELESYIRDAAGTCGGSTGWILTWCRALCPTCRSGSTLLAERFARHEQTFLQDAVLQVFRTFLATSAFYSLALTVKVKKSESASGETWGGRGLGQQAMEPRAAIALAGWGAKDCCEYCEAAGATNFAVEAAISIS
jgi:hypothetical protein